VFGKYVDVVEIIKGIMMYKYLDAFIKIWKWCVWYLDEILLRSFHTLLLHACKKWIYLCNYFYELI